MAGERTVKVSILGDSKSLQGAFGAAEKSSGGFLSHLSNFAVVGAVAFAGAEKLGGALLNMAQGAADDEASVRKLQQTVQNMGGTWDGHTGAINDAIAAGQKLGFQDDAIRDGLGLLIEQTGSQDEALRRMTIAQDLARGTGLDLQTASKLVGKVTDETTEVLKRYGITLGENATQEEALQAIEKRFGGQSAAYAQTAAGKMAILRDRFSELRETIGYKVLPILLALTNLVLDKVLPAAERLTNWLSGPLQSAFESVVNFIRGPTKAAFDTIAGVVDTLASAFGDDGLRGVLAAIPGLFQSAGAAILDAIVAGFESATDFGVRVATWVADKITGVDWGSTASAAGAAVLNGILAGFDAVTDFGSRVATYIGNAITAVDWAGSASSAGSAILNGVVAGFDAVTDFGSRFVTWLVNAITAIDYGNTGKAVLDGIIAGFNATVGWGTQFVTWLWGAVSSPDYGSVASGILDKIVSAFYTVKGWGESFVSWVSTTVGSVDWGGVATAIGSNIVSAFYTVKGWGEAFVQWFDTTILAADWSKVGQDIADKINQALTAAKIDEQANALLQSLQPLIDRMNEDWKVTVENFALSIENLKKAVDDLGLSIPGMDWSAFATAVGVTLVGPTVAFTELLRVLSGVLVELSAQTEITINAIVTTITGAWSGLTSATSATWDAVSGIPGIVTSGIYLVKDTIGPILGALRDEVWGPVWDAIQSKVSDIWDAVIGVPGIAARGMSSLKEAIVGGLRGGAETIQGIWDTTWDEIKGKIEAVAGAMEGIGEDIVSGVAEGIRAGAHLVTEAVNYLISLIPDKLQSILGIKSPSKVMHDEVGIPISEGIATGIIAGADQYIPAAMAYVQSVIDANEPTFPVGPPGTEPTFGTMPDPIYGPSPVPGIPGVIYGPSPYPGGGGTGGAGSGTGGTTPATGIGSGADTTTPPYNPLTGTGNLGGAGELGSGGGGSRLGAFNAPSGKRYNDTPQGTQPDSLGRLPGNPCWGKPSSCEVNLGIDASHPDSPARDMYSQVGPGYTGGYQSGLAGHDSGEVAYSQVTSDYLNPRTGLHQYGGISAGSGVFLDGFLVGRFLGFRHRREAFSLRDPAGACS